MKSLTIFSAVVYCYIFLSVYNPIMSLTFAFCCVDKFPLFLSSLLSKELIFLFTAFDVIIVFILSIL